MNRRRPIPKTYFPTLEFRENSRLRPERYFREFNIAHAWAEAELFIISKLKEGEHPGVCEEILNTAIAKSGGDDYRMKFLEFSIRILRNFRVNMLIDNLITTREYDENIADDYEKKARFEISMANICYTYKEELRAFALDEEMLEMLERTPELDKEAQETLKFLWELRGTEADEHYGDNLLLIQPTSTRAYLDTLAAPMGPGQAQTLGGNDMTKSL